MRISSAPVGDTSVGRGRGGAAKVCRCALVVTVTETAVRAMQTAGPDAELEAARVAVFGALSLYADATTDRQRWPARLTVVASLGTLFVSLTRGPLIAFGAALLLLVLPKRGNSRRSALPTCLGSRF